MDYADITITSYQINAEKYAQKRLGYQTDSERFLKKFIKLLPGNKVLEIGFGLGFDANWFVANNIFYIGVEPVKTFYEKLKKDLPQAKLINRDIRKVNFPKGSFDGVYAMASLLHFNNKDIEDLILQISNWLRPGGLLFVTLKEGVGEVIRDDGRYFNLFTREKFEKIVRPYFKTAEFSINKPNEYNIGQENWLNFYLRKI